MNMLQCHACGKTFRSMSKEAFHRHNFPALCNKSSKAWKAFQAEIAAPVLGNAELDAGAPNHADHTKRGFNPK